MKKKVSQMLDSFLYMQEDLEQDNGHFSILVQRKSGTHESSPQCEWDKMAELMMLKFAESGHPSLPSHESIVQRSDQEQKRWKTVDTLLCRW